MQKEKVQDVKYTNIILKKEVAFKYYLQSNKSCLSKTLFSFCWQIICGKRLSLQNTLLSGLCGQPSWRPHLCRLRPQVSPGMWLWVLMVTTSRSLTPCPGDPEASAEDSTCSADESCVQCKCLPLGCDCDPSAEDPNSFCPSGDVCKVSPWAPHNVTLRHLTLSQDCQCQPPFPPGCDCDPGADDPNESCSPGNECVQCVCLPQGCDCDPSAEDPDSFCPAGEKWGDKMMRKIRDKNITRKMATKILFRCDECQCRRPLPPGCECDQESDNPDELCPGDLR